MAPQTSVRSNATCFNCEGTQVCILYLFYESMIHAGLALPTLADAMGWVMVDCMYCRPDAYWKRSVM